MMMVRADLTVFIVDDDESVCRALGRLMKSVGYKKVETFNSVEAFLSRAPLEGPSVLILDLRMPGMGGIELQRHLRESGYQIPIVFISAHVDELARAKAMGTEALAFLKKPFDDEDLLAAIRAAGN